MATVHARDSKLRDKLSSYLNRGPHSVWDRFGAEEQEQMLRDDLNAGTSVSVLLFALITTGMVLSIATLLAVVFFG